MDKPPPPPPVPSARQLTAWIMRPDDKLDETDRLGLKTACAACPELATLTELANGFNELVRTRGGARLEALLLRLATGSAASPAVSLCHTCRYPSSANKDPASNRYTTTRAGSRRVRRLAGLVAATASSTISISVAAASALREMGSSSAVVCAESSDAGAVSTYAAAGFTAHEQVADLQRGA